jgi:hypothetical protein
MAFIPPEDALVAEPPAPATFDFTPPEPRTPAEPAAPAVAPVPDLSLEPQPSGIAEKHNANAEVSAPRTPIRAAIRTTLMSAL